MSQRDRFSCCPLSLYSGSQLWGESVTKAPLTCFSLSKVNHISICLHSTALSEHSSSRYYLCMTLLFEGFYIILFLLQIKYLSLDSSKFSSFLMSCFLFHIKLELSTLISFALKSSRDCTKFLVRRYSCFS